MTRIQLLPVMLTIGVLILLVRTVFLQIIKGDEYRKLAEGNRIQEEVIHAPRGIIYDRNGYPITRNIPGFRAKENDQIKVIKREEALARQSVAAGDEVTVDTIREYIYPDEFSHVLGFVGEGENINQIAGRAGLEKQYNSILSGIDGKRLIEVDAGQKILRVLGEVKPKNGEDLKTTLDLALQKKAYEALIDVKLGALIAQDPRNGEVLAILSKPSFNPNLFTIGAQRAERASSNLVYKTAEEILSSPDEPLFNRAIGGTYPPGSTFKIITAAAGLEEGKITKDAKIEDVGVLQIGRFTFPNWYFTQYGRLEGELDVVGAIKRSNDIFFYKTAEFVGLEKLSEWAKKFGLDNSLGIDLEGEAKGLFPTDVWKRKVVNEPWYLGDTYHLGIGQGYMLTTPLQMNAWTAVIANGGTLYQPRLVKNNPINKSSNQPINTNFLKKETVELIKEGMRQACSPGGTGWPLFRFQIVNSKLKIDNRNFFPPVVATESGKVHIPVACKTGTAEFGDPKDRTHAWFTAFAPIEDPQIVVTVLVEGGGEGSNVAAPIAKKVFEEWFSR